MMGKAFEVTCVFLVCQSKLQLHVEFLRLYLYLLAEVCLDLSGDHRRFA